MSNLEISVSTLEQENNVIYYTINQGIEYPPSLDHC